MDIAYGNLRYTDKMKPRMGAEGAEKPRYGPKTSKLVEPEGKTRSVKDR